jgi:hypothetical protein
MGLLIGAMLPFVFSSMAMKAVGKAANAMVEEVRRQFREIPGLKDGTGGEADYARCVAISTEGALREMVVPGLLAVVAPVLMGMIFGKAAVGGLLAGALGGGRHDGPVHGQRRRRLGQRQEVHRSRPPRWQGQRHPQGGGHRRHGRRPVQGHRRPVDQHPHEADDDRRRDRLPLFT